VPEVGQKPLFWNFHIINFSDGKKEDVHSQETRKGRLSERQKMFDQMTA